MGQQANPKRTTDTESRAYAKTLRVTPRKLGLVAGLIQGKSAAAALNLLTFSKRRIAGDVKKLLQSAIANAENNHRLDIDRLVVSEASVGKAFVMKRFSARGRGKSAGIHKFFSNMTIVLREAGTEGSTAMKTDKPAKKTRTPKDAKTGEALRSPKGEARAKKTPAKTAKKETA